eukprot:g569.t1
MLVWDASASYARFMRSFSNTKANIIQKEETVVSRSDVSKDGAVMSLTTGKIAPLCDGSVVARHGDTVVLSTAVSQSLSLHKSLGKSRPSFLPLSVDVREKTYSLGEIPTTRTGREFFSDTEVLLSRMVDRSIRPLFPRGYFLETQVISTVLSFDDLHMHDVLSINGASAALCVSDIPWNGPLAAVRVGLIDGEFVANPSRDEMRSSASELNLVYVGTGEDGGKVIMLESDGYEVPKDQYAEALRFAARATAPILDMQRELASKVGRPKREMPPMIPDPEILDAATTFGLDAAMSVLRLPDLSKQERGVALGAARDETKAHVAKLCEASSDTESDASELSVVAESTVPDLVCKRAYRRLVLDEGRRADGRDLDEVRPLLIHPGNLPDTVHGSAYFGRGDTHTQCSATLGNFVPRKTQFAKMDVTVAGNGKEDQLFMLQYEFPPYSVNETGRVGGINRRMIGHGKLAEKAIAPLLFRDGSPKIGPGTDFPYFVKAVSEITASDGSSSMATVCGASLALFDAGVPLDASVAGVSVGLMTPVEKRENGRTTGGEIVDDDERWKDYRILTDIRGLEDHYGDMDFKIAGTKRGLTAVQLDIKLPNGVPVDVLCEALDQGERARHAVLDQMTRVVGKPRASVKDAAPQAATLTIAGSGARGTVIGKGGSTIRLVEALFGASIKFGDNNSLDESAPVSLTLLAPSRKDLRRARAAIEGVLLYKVGESETCEAVVTKHGHSGIKVALKAASAEAREVLEASELDMLHSSVLGSIEREGYIPKSKLPSPIQTIQVGDKLSATRIGSSLKGAGIFEVKSDTPVTATQAPSSSSSGNVAGRRRKKQQRNEKNKKVGSPKQSRVGDGESKGREATQERTQDKRPPRRNAGKRGKSSANLRQKASDAKSWKSDQQKARVKSLRKDVEKVKQERREKTEKAPENKPSEIFGWFKRKFGA